MIFFFHFFSLFFFLKFYENQSIMSCIKNSHLSSEIIFVIVHLMEGKTLIIFKAEAGFLPHPISLCVISKKSPHGCYLEIKGKLQIGTWQKQQAKCIVGSQECFKFDNDGHGWPVGGGSLSPTLSLHILSPLLSSRENNVHILIF